MRFEDELTRGFNFAKRGLPLGVVLINVRTFGAINRELGRDGGDHLLKLMADVLRNNIRKTDLAARFDSDDFALILPNMETGRVVAWLEQLEQRFMDAQRNDAVLAMVEPRRLRVGYAFVQELMDKDAHEVWERANRALEQTTESGAASIIGA
jgi:diguanylate cyclase (GGDEF)-like protein